MGDREVGHALLVGALEGLDLSSVDASLSCQFKQSRASNTSVEMGMQLDFRKRVASFKESVERGGIHDDDQLD